MSTKTLEEINKYVEEIVNMLDFAVFYSLKQKHLLIFLNHPSHNCLGYSYIKTQQILAQVCRRFSQNHTIEVYKARITANASPSPKAIRNEHGSVKYLLWSAPRFAMERIRLQDGTRGVGKWGVAARVLCSHDCPTL